MTPQEVISLCRQEDVKLVDLRIADLVGHWHRITIPVSCLDEGAFDQGWSFDGSRMIGWQTVNESDLRAIPQPETAFVDPFPADRTLAISCNVQDPLSGDDYDRDPRHIATKAANYLRQTGIADTASVLPTLEYYTFPAARYQQTGQHGYYFLGTTECDGQSRAGNHSPGAIAPEFLDAQNDMFSSLSQPSAQPTSGIAQLLQCGVRVATSRVGKAGGTGGAQPWELALEPHDLLSMADQVIRAKYAVKAQAAGSGLAATFMPQPIWQAAGCGMATHLGFWKDDVPLFAGGQYVGLSDMAMAAMAGILRHAPALMAFTNPTTNSYKRMARGGLGPTRCGYSKRDRSAACRVPVLNDNPTTKGIEFRCPDPSSNPYLAFAAILMAALDGIQEKLSPGLPLDSPERTTEEPNGLPTTLEQALDALARDHDFLLESNVFTADVIRTWITIKEDHDIQPLRSRPHPHEFELYF